MENLEGKAAVITGASSGIGAATSRMLAAGGVSVVLAARREMRLAQLQKEIEDAGGVARTVVTDVTDQAAVQHAVDEAVKHFGSVDILVNNAGVMPLSYMEKLHEEEWERMVDVNVKGVLYGVGAVLPIMMRQRSGHIVNVSSVAGKRVFPGGAVYCATKYFVRALSEGLRRELAPKHKIRVTCIEPGVVDTELTDTITDAKVKKRFDEMEWEALQSEDIAEAILYALTTPERVDVAEMLVMPREQGS